MSRRNTRWIEGSAYFCPGEAFSEHGKEAFIGLSEIENSRVTGGSLMVSITFLRFLYAKRTSVSRPARSLRVWTSSGNAGSK